MGRHNIYKMMSVASVMPPSMMQDLLDFLMRNNTLILSKDKTHEVFRTRFVHHSVLSDIVYRLTVMNKDQTYSLIKIPTKTVSLSEAVDMTFLPIDVMQMKDIVPTVNKTLSVFPSLDDKLIINITDITKANGDFSDVTQFYYRVVRDFLSRSYFVNGGNIWISPALVRYVAKVYSMTIGGQITKLFGLSQETQVFIQTIFCAFFVSQMTSQDVALTFLKVHAKHMGLPDAAQLSQITALMQDVLGKPVPTSLEEVCQVIDAYDHSQLKTDHGSRINRPILNMKFAALFPEARVSITALEYPPYFLFLIILVLSNTRIGLSFPMKNMNLIREGQEVLEGLVKSPLFFSGI